MSFPTGIHFLTMERAFSPQELHEFNKRYYIVMREVNGPTKVHHAQSGNMFLVSETDTHFQIWPYDPAEKQLVGETFRTVPKP